MSEAVKTPEQEAELDLGWLDQMGEWGMKAAPGKGGMTLTDIQIGTYGEVPEHSQNMTGRPRGAGKRPDAFRVGGYEIRDKQDIWLDNAALLYEEAQNRQWSSATDIPWETIKPLPDDVEQAQCQLATFLTEVEFVAGDVPAKWIAKTTPANPATATPPDAPSSRSNNASATRSIPAVYRTNQANPWPGSQLGSGRGARSPNEPKARSSPGRAR